MNTNTKNNQFGFSVVEILAVLVIIGLVACTGFYVWNRNHSKQSANNFNKTHAPAIVDGPNANDDTGNQAQVTYTDSADGFKFLYPKYISGDIACTFNDTNRQYAPVTGKAETVVIRDGDIYYLTQKTAYRQQLKWSGDAYDSIACDSVPTTLDVAKQQNELPQVGDKYTYSSPELKFLVKRVDDTQAITQTLQKYWNDSTITVSGWKKSDNGNWQVPVNIRCNHPNSKPMDNDCGPTASNNDIRYYSDKGLLFYVQYGNGSHLIHFSVDPNKQDSADFDIAAGFSPL